MCKPNMALHSKWEIRPKVVLECSFRAKNVLEKRVRGASKGFARRSDFGGRSSSFMVHKRSSILGEEDSKG